MNDQQQQDLENAMIESAKGPASVSVDGTTIGQHNLRDLIELEKHLAAKRSIQKGGLGIILKRLVPPGTV